MSSVSDEPPPTVLHPIRPAETPKEHEWTSSSTRVSMTRTVT
jgi:hypothetical protein